MVLKVLRKGTRGVSRFRLALTVLFVAAASLFSSTHAQSNLRFVRLHRLALTTDGGRPIAGVIQASDGYFYGTAICGGNPGPCDNTWGVVFRLDGVATSNDGAGYTVLHAFTGNVDGGYPQGGLIQGSDGNFYGMTNCGGASACYDQGGSGVIYRLTPGGAYSVLYAFNAETDGTGPYSSLVQGRDGSLYGLTWCGGGGLDCLNLPGGEDGGGTIFKFNPQTSEFTVLHSFGNGDPSGCKSLGTLVEDKTTNGVFYGAMNECGGPIGGGTIFRINASQPPATNLTVLHSFTGYADGSHPVAGLTFGSDGALYGTTEFGGFFYNYDGFGTIFKINTDGSGFQTLYTFKGTVDGGNPYAGIVHAHDGTLYGTAFYPSPIRPTGTVYRLDPGSAQYDTVYTFSGGFDGQNPSGTLVQIDETLAPGFTGSLVGTTMLGPTTFDSAGNVTDYGSGVTFRFTPPPVLICPADPVPVTATSAAGASGTLGTTLIDPSNMPTTLTWRIDGSLFQTDNIPAAPSSALSSRTNKSFTATYSAGLAGSAASQHTVFIEASNSLGFTSTCTVTVEVDKLAQSITFAPVPVQTYANPNGTVTLSATSLSGATPTGLAVSFAVISGPGVLAGDLLTITGAGSIVVQAYQNGDGQYNAATSVSQTITVNKANQTISFAVIPNQTFANPAPALSLTPSSTSGLPVTLSVTGAATLTQNGVNHYTLTLTGAGSVTVTASQAGNSNYNAAADVPRPFTTAKGNQTITFPVVPPQTYSNPNGTVTLAATSNSALAVSYSVSGPGTISGTVLTITGAGTITVTASQPGNANFNAAVNVSQNIVVAKSAQTITFPAVAPQTYSNPNGSVTLNATSDSGLAVSYVVTSGPGTIAGNVLTITGAGNIVVTASQPGNANYGAATSVSQTVVVAKANQTITFPAITPQTYLNPPVTLAATSNSGLPVSYSVTGPASVSGNVLTITGAGTIVITATQAGNANYAAAAPVSQTIVVARANQTINFAAVPTQFTGNPPVTLTATASSGLPVTFAVVSGPGTIAGNVLTITGPGTVVVTAAQAGNANCNPAAASQNVTVLDATQSPLRRFVAFSTDLTWLHTGTVVTTGDVGANMARIHGDDDDNDDVEEHDDRHDTTVRLDNRVVMQQDTSRVVGDAVLLGAGATVYHVVENSLPSHNGIILGTRIDTLALPYLTMPVFPAVTPGAQDVTVRKNTVVTLAAGAYRKVKVENGGTLKLLGGLYQVTSLDVQPKATVQFEAAAEVRVQTTLVAGTDSKLVTNASVAGLSAALVKIFVTGDVTIGERGIVKANIYSPDGTITFKSHSDGTGAFVGKHVNIGSFSRLTLDSSFF